jgi:hypothetical protein
MSDRTGKEPDDVDERAAQRRRELWMLHAELPSTAELDPAELDPAELDAADETVEKIFELTEELLSLEAAAAEQRELAEHARSSRVIYWSAGALGVVSAVPLGLGLLLGWYPGWGLAVLVANLLVALGMAGIHAVATRAGHRERRRHAVVALGVGVVLAAVAPWWLPWWAALGGLAATLGNGWIFVSAARGHDQR